MTTKSSGIIGQPIRSHDATNGSFVFGSNPAMTGSMKYGPNLCHETFISAFSITRSLKDNSAVFGMIMKKTNGILDLFKQFFTFYAKLSIEISNQRIEMSHSTKNHVLFCCPTQ